jgi:metal-sulfur cluster biosynthetic enzyme
VSERPQMYEPMEETENRPEVDEPPQATDQSAVETGGNGAVQDPEDLRQRIIEALKNVVDPELGINIVDLGLVYGIDLQGSAVHITYTLTTMGCPIGPLIEAEMKQFLSGVGGVDEIEAEMVLRPPWTPEMMSEEAKAALGFF